MKSILLIALIFLLAQTAFAQLNPNKQFRFAHLNASDGLSQNSVNDIYQDKWGYLWFATQDGLNKYDGYGFEIFRNDPDDPWSISDNFIIKIFPEGNGDLWLTTREGLNYYERSSGRFYKYYENPDSLYNEPYCIVEWKGKRWTLFKGRPFLLREKHDKAEQVLEPCTECLPIDTIIAAATLLDDILILNTQDYIYLLKENSIDSFPMPEGEWTNKFEAPVQQNDSIILFPIDQRLFSINTYQNKLSEINLPHEGGFYIQDILVMPNNHIWMASNQGIFIVANDSCIARIKYDQERADGISYPLVHSLHRDRSGSVWVGTANGGIDYLPSGSQRFISISDKDGLLDNQIWGLYSDKEGTVWVGNEKGLNQISFYQPDSGFTSALGLSNIKDISTFKGTGKQLVEKRVSAITQDSEDQLWIGTFGGGLFHISPDNKDIQQLYIPDSSRAAQNISCLVQIDSTMWVGTFNGIYLYDLKGNFRNSYATGKLESGYILSLNLDKDGYLNIGSNIGLSKLDLTTSEITNYKYSPKSGNKSPSFYFVNGIERVSQNEVWLALFGGGINLLEERDSSYTFFMEKEGLANNVVAKMLPDKDALWLSTNNGISRFSLTDSSFNNFSVADGLTFPEFSLGAGVIGKNHEVIFGGTGGIIALNPADFSETHNNLQPILTQLEVNYERVENSRVLSSIEELAQIKLFPDDKVITFHFAAIDFTHAKGLKYAYKLEGFDDKWVEVDALNRRATYSSPGAGSYAFRVKVADQNGKWSSKQMAITVEVIPPIWLRWWFILSASILILIILISSVRYFAQRKIKKQLKELEMKQRVQKERERISRDLHDHVGAQMTYIISNLDRLGHTGVKKEESSIHELGDFARDTMRQLRDTIWAIRSDSMSLEEFVQRLRVFGNQLFENTKTHFDVVNKVTRKINLQPAQAMSLYRIAQESIHNARKHAQAAELIISFTLEGNELNVEIRDNGKGFNPKMVTGSDHNGLNNMKQRAEDIGALFIIKTGPGKGTQTIIKLPTGSE